MELNPKTINEILGLYEKYCKIMQLDKLPVLTLNEKEYLEILEPHEIKTTKTRINKRLGECKYGIKGNNDIIFINSEKCAKLLGQESFSEPYKVKKRKYTYTIQNKIGTIEHTLIHELCHLRFKGLNHGKLFEQHIKYYYQKGNEYIPEITE